MANASLLMPKILKWEGGYVNNPLDKGGPTMKGVTLTTFRQFFGSSKTIEDLKRISNSQWLTIFKSGYWNPCRADYINSQSVANLIVDWAYNSGVKTAIKKVQSILGVTVDGIVGSQTINAINRYDSQILFNYIWNKRKQFYYDIVRSNPSQSKFLKGWLNRLNDYRYED